MLAFNEGTLTAVDAAKAKWWSAEIQNDVIDACVQLYGGYGYMNEYRVARAWRDARVTKIWAGSNEIMKEPSVATSVLAPAHPSGRRSQGVPGVGDDGDGVGVHGDGVPAVVQVVMTSRTEKGEV